jgi:very-short-patch-repair endonuclease
MTSIGSLIDDNGGLLHKRQLVRLGATDRHLTWAVRHTGVRRPRRGWYSTWPPSDPRFVSVRVGGRLTGAAALEQMGAWIWRRRGITVSVPGNAARLRRVRGVHVVWDSRELLDRGTAWSVGLRDALRQALLELPFEEAVAVLDWALHTQRIDESDIGRLLVGLPQDLQRIGDWVDPNCQSIIESLGRTRLRIAGHSVSTQEPVGGNRFIDLVVDDVVGLELDGRAFHSDSFEKDRRKDLEIIIEGRTAIRASYQMVDDSWDRVESAVEAAVTAHRGAACRVGNSGHLPRPARCGPRLWRLGRRRSSWPELPEGATGDRDGGRPTAKRRLRRGLSRRIATIDR